MIRFCRLKYRYIAVKIAAAMHSARKDTHAAALGISNAAAAAERTKNAAINSSA